MVCELNIAYSFQLRSITPAFVSAKPSEPTPSAALKVAMSNIPKKNTIPGTRQHQERTNKVEGKGTDLYFPRVCFIKMSTVGSSLRTLRFSSRWSCAGQVWSMMFWISVHAIKSFSALEALPG